MTGDQTANAVYLLLAVVLVASALFSRRLPVGQTVKMLAAWAAIFAAATAFAGIWGMNFEFMPELKLRWGYPAALGVIGCTCAVLWWRFRRAGWL